MPATVFENRSLAYDTWMDGVKSSYQNGFLKATVVGGRIDYRDSITITRHEMYKLRGGNLEIHPVNSILIGLSYVNATGVIPQGPDGSAIPAKDINAEIPEIYLSMNAQHISVYLDWARKWTNVISDGNASTGWGAYGAVSYLGSGFGITLDYKNYRFDIEDPYGRSDYANPRRMLPFQNPPVVQREYSFTLLSRPLHMVNFNDEVGFQIEAYYSPTDASTLTLNASYAGTHDAFLLNPDGYTFRESKRSLNFFPSSDKMYFPYFEVFVELEHSLDDHTDLRVASARREETFFNEFSADKSSTITRSTVFPAQIEHDFAEGVSITFQSEYELVSLTSPAGDSHYINHFLLAKGTFLSALTTEIRYEYTTSPNEPSDRKDWTLFEIGYRITPSNLATFSYGKERGGQVCSNGVCKYLQPFSGFRFSLQTQI